MCLGAGALSMEALRLRLIPWASLFYAAVHTTNRKWGTASSAPQDRTHGSWESREAHRPFISTLCTLSPCLPNLPILTQYSLPPPPPRSLYPLPPQHCSGGKQSKRQLSTRQHLFETSVSAASRWCYWACSHGRIFGSLPSKRFTVTEECHQSTEGVHQVISNCQQRIITYCMWKEKLGGESRAKKA